MELIGIHHVGISVEQKQQWHLWARNFLQFDRQIMVFDKDEAQFTNNQLQLLIHPQGGGGLAITQAHETTGATKLTAANGWKGIQLMGFNPSLIQGVLKTDHIPSYLSTQPNGLPCILAEDALGIYWNFVETRAKFRQRNIPNGGVIGLQVFVESGAELVQWWKTLFSNLTLKPLGEKIYEDVLASTEPCKRWVITTEPTKQATQTIWQSCTIDIVSKQQTFGQTAIQYVAFEVSDVYALQCSLKDGNNSVGAIHHLTGDNGFSFSYFFTYDPVGNKVAFCSTTQIPLLPKQKWLKQLTKSSKRLKPWHKNLFYATLQKTTPPTK